MSAALCALHEIIKQDPLPYKNLVPSFISILKQVNCCQSTLSVHTKWMRACSCQPIQHCLYLKRRFRMSMRRSQNIVFQRRMTTTDHLHPSYRQAGSTLSCLLWSVLAQVAFQGSLCPHQVVAGRCCNAG